MKQTKINRITELLESSLEEVRKVQPAYLQEWNAGFIKGLELALLIVNVVNKKIDKMIDTGTEYHYINIEKNGKRGGIIL
jgi:hypothetical protein